MNTQIDQPLDLAAAYQHGYSITEIARQAGRSRSWTRRKLLQLGVDLPVVWRANPRPVAAVWELPPQARVANVARSHAGVSATFIDRFGREYHDGPAATRGLIATMAPHMLSMPFGSTGMWEFKAAGCDRIICRWRAGIFGVSIVGIVGSVTDVADVVKSIPRYLTRIAGEPNAANR